MVIDNSIFFDIDQETNSIISEIADESIRELNNLISSVNYIKGFSDAGNMKFSKPISMADDYLGIPEEMGVYLIFCNEALFYVGYGKLASRVSKFKRTIKSNDTGHHGAVKARNENSNVLDYTVSYIRIPNEHLAKKLEIYYIETYSPKFSETSQAGK
jgi:hypothetical protein